MTDQERTRRWVLGLTACASLMVALDALVVTTALATIERELNAALDHLEWVVNAYLLAFAMLLMTGAALGDRFGRRRLFGLGIALFVAASIACALAGTITALIAARAVQGVGAALVMPTAMALLTQGFPREIRGRALGIFSGVTGLAVLSGPVIGGAIAAGIDWRWIFWLNLPIGAAVLLLGRRHLAESRGADTALDLPGLVLISGAMLGVVWGLMRQDLESLGGGAVLFAGFLVRQAMAAQPMMPLRLFAHGGFAAGLAVTLFLYAALHGAVFFMAQYLQTGLGHGPFAAGLRLLPWTATLFVTAPVAGRLVDRVGERPLIAAGLGLQALGLGWIAATARIGMPYAAMVAPLIVAGCGVSMAMPAVQNAVMSAVPAAAIGKASGIFNTLRQLGAALGVTLLAAVFAGHGDLGSAAGFVGGVGPALGLAALLSFCGAVAGLALPGRPRFTPAKEMSS